MDTDRSRGEKKKRKVDPKNELLLKFWLETDVKKTYFFCGKTLIKTLHIECHVF